MTSPMKAFRSTAAVASMHNPFFGTTLQHTRGCYLGRQRVTGRPAYWSPALLKERGLIRNTLVGVFVPQGGGKSTLAKSLVLRASALQSGIGQDGMPLRTRVQVNDHDTKSADGRGEYALVADHLMTPSVRLADIGSVNVFPMGMGLTLDGDTKTLTINNRTGSASIIIDDDGIVLSGNVKVPGGMTMGGAGAVPLALATLVAAELAKRDASIVQIATLLNAPGPVSGAPGSVTPPVAGSVAATLVTGK